MMFLRHFIIMVSDRMRMVIIMDMIILITTVMNMEVTATDMNTVRRTAIQS